MSDILFNADKVCPVCGKTFAVMIAETWAYQRGFRYHTKYMCSWKCLRAFDEQKEGRKAQGKRDPKRQEKIIALAAEGKSVYEIKEALGVSVQLASYYKRKVNAG